jgi:hypothetical protein
VLRRTLPILLLGLLATGPAEAGTIGVVGTVAAGALSVRAGSATATSHAPVSVAVTVVDARGSGKGWTLRVGAAQAVRIQSVTARCAAHSTCTLPRAATDAGGDVVLRAAANSGMGAIDLVVTVAPLPVGSAPAALGFRVS